ncbi:hypothetical protein FA15DRAFT_664413 [Coprinopsis marcescibilis]|uniref:ATPase inhibitor, mitochondrial n=1 Tax=Coprinopsis marcescibilis TaxID=230819 RepID=A0A5C3L8G5_COPMA|nr:hypothetical protein FA15DRAFT_664413 [Coprinopsis marcescibilis]
MLALRRIAATPRTVPAAFLAVRNYSVAGRAEGSVAQSKGFNKKEKAHEDQYVHNHELEQLKKLKASIEAKKAELNKLEQEHADLENNAEKK